MSSASRLSVSPASLGMPVVERDMRFKPERAGSEAELSGICLKAMFSVFACVPSGVEDRLLKELETWMNRPEQTEEIARRCREACVRAVARAKRREAGAAKNAAFDFKQALRDDPELAPLLRGDRITDTVDAQLPAEPWDEWRGFTSRKRDLASDLGDIARYGARQYDTDLSGTVTVFPRALRGSFPSDQDRNMFSEHLDADDLRTIHASVAWETLADRYLALLADKNGPYARALSGYAENIRGGVAEAFVGALESGRHPLALRIRTFRESVRHFFERQQQAKEAKKELEAAMRAKQNPSADRIREAQAIYARSISALGEAYDRLLQWPDAGLDGGAVVAEFRRAVADAAGYRMSSPADDPIRRAVADAEKAMKRAEAKPLDIRPADDIQDELAAAWMEVVVASEREKAESDESAASPLSELLRSLRTVQDALVAVQQVANLRQSLRADMERALRAEKSKWFIQRLEELSSRLRNFLSSANAFVALSPETVAPSEVPALMDAVSRDLRAVLDSRRRRVRASVGESLHEAVSAGAREIGSPVSARQAAGAEILGASEWGTMLDSLRDAHAKSMARADAPDRIRKEPKPARAQRIRPTDRTRAEASVDAGPTLRQHRQRLSGLVSAGLEAVRPKERGDLPAVAEFRTGLRADVLAGLEESDSVLAKEYRDIYDMLVRRDRLIEEGESVKQALRKADDPAEAAGMALALGKTTDELRSIRAALSKREDAGESAIRDFERRLTLAIDPLQDDIRLALADFERASASVSIISSQAFRETASWAFLRAKTGVLGGQLDRIDAIAADLEAFFRAQASHRQARTQLNGLYAVISKMTKEDAENIQSTISRLSEETARHARSMEEIGGRLDQAIFDRARRMLRSAVSETLAGEK